ncbi:acyltransferase family protein [Sinomonas gamaensis]|uniref:acyltransferase family protein n=1 Tax=Sinomonas gamaensis TaxID=2565624 RepID=UPI00110809D0|nr:acyltransferase [Sinomonas gamaensis]
MNPNDRSPLLVPRARRGLQSNFSIAVALDPSRNSLNALRLLLAAAVIVSHAWVLGGYGAEPSLFGINLGRAGVMGFFGISGYLITISAQRARFVQDYLLARFIRVYPALAMAALLISVVAAPIGAIITAGQYDVCGALAFLAAVLTLAVGVIGTPPIGTSLQGNPNAGEWDSPLWTLTWEALGYLILAVVVIAARRTDNAKSAPVAGAFLFVAVSSQVAARIFQGGPVLSLVDFAMPLMACFLAGSVVAHFRGHIPVGFVPVAAAAAATWAALASGFGPALAPLPLTYLILCAGSLKTFSRVGSKYDISYGVYIYGWPVQQLLEAVHLPSVLPPLGYAAVALVAVAPLGLLSCVFIEQPAQRWRKRWVSRRESKMLESRAA